MPNVSFIIPAYNEEENIELCINTIRREIYSWKYMNPDSNFEIIVVDNNSTDATSEYAKHLGALVIKELVPGVTHARQAGYKVAQYEYQAYIDADNYLPSGWLKCIKKFDENTVAISGRPYFPEFNIFYRFFSYCFFKIQKVTHKYAPSLQGGNYIVKKSALDSVGGHSTNFEFYGEDTDLAVRLSKYGKIKLLDEMWCYSSARRFENEGLIKATFIYIINYLSVNFFHKAVTKTHKDYR